MNNFINLEQGDMTVSKYDKKFISLSYFADYMNPSSDIKARMFENKLHPWYNNFVSLQCLPTFKVVVDYARVIEHNKDEEKKKNRDAQAMAK